jgi:hypothetical protein
MKKGQKYVVRCHKRVACKTVGLGHSGHYEVGDLVSDEGGPVKNIEQASVYEVDEEDFPWTDDIRGEDIDKWFEPVPVRIVVIES